MGAEVDLCQRELNPKAGATFFLPEWPLESYGIRSSIVLDVILCIHWTVDLV